MFFKIGVLKNFANLVRKQRPVTSLKRDYNTVVFLWILKNFKNSFFQRTPPVAASSYIINGKILKDFLTF